MIYTLVGGPHDGERMNLPALPPGDRMRVPDEVDIGGLSSIAPEAFNPAKTISVSEYRIEPGSRLIYIQP